MIADARRPRQSALTCEFGYTVHRSVHLLHSVLKELALFLAFVVFVGGLLEQTHKLEEMIHFFTQGQGDAGGRPYLCGRTNTNGSVTTGRSGKQTWYTSK